MKKRSKKAFYRKTKEFRFHNIAIINKKGKKKNIRHPAYIFLKKGNLYIFVSLTHSKSVNKHIVIKLRKNPNPQDNNDAFYVAEIKADTKDTFGKIQNWIMCPADDEEIRKLFDKKR